MQTIGTILIANRGEISSRIIRTCRKMGIRSIAVYSDADKNAPFVREADLALWLGAPEPHASYLNASRIIELANQNGADAIHPGYGFLSENADFAAQCEAAGLCFIGPNPDAIRAMGSKSAAKQLMADNGVPVIPGLKETAPNNANALADFSAKADEMGYPVLIKAAAGGGGKGMRIVNSAAEMKDAIEAARREAETAFGDSELILEKYILDGRHIEFQIFGDKHGNTIHLYERECSMQRRYQKVVEESPSPAMTPALRERMAAAAVKAARALNYDNAGTVEFIFDDQSGEFYFLEVNTRLQVEHPVTEAVTGLDLVQLQIESAAGSELRISQEAVSLNGYALEVRLYAEDPGNDFLPQTGSVINFSIPEVEGLRIESAIESGSEISVYYDPMIAKIIVHDSDRASASRKMQYVLRHLRCLGTQTNQAFLLALLQHPAFVPGNYHTNFIEREFTFPGTAEDGKRKPANFDAAIATCLSQWQQRENSRSILGGISSGWRNNFYQPQQFNYAIGEAAARLWYRCKDGAERTFDFSANESMEEAVSVQILEYTSGKIRLELAGKVQQYFLATDKTTCYVQNESIGQIDVSVLPRFPEKANEEIPGAYLAPMPSQVVKVLVASGDKVASGDNLIVLSSMKMENTITASEAGTVAEVYATAGENVEANFLLLKIDA